MHTAVSACHAWQNWMDGDGKAMPVNDYNVRHNVCVRVCVYMARASTRDYPFSYAHTDPKPYWLAADPGPGRTE